MKRIDLEKTAASSRNDNVAAPVQTAESATWQEAWTAQFSHGAELYGRLFAGLRDETAGFVHKRIEADMEAARAWGTCRSMNEVLELQQKWLQDAVEHYSAQSLKMADLCQRAFGDAVPTAAEMVKATERKTAEPLATSVPRAAE
jgi:hypothetical protein